MLCSSVFSYQVLAVASHDIGEYVRCYPRGKKVLDSTGAKTAVMGLMMDSTDSNVRYEALVAVQKLMTNNWYVHLLCMCVFAHFFYLLHSIQYVYCCLVVWFASL